VARRGFPRAAAPVAILSFVLAGVSVPARAQVDDFNATQRDVRVVITTLTWGEPFYTKLITASVVGAGPSGCGKSILLRTIAGLEDITDVPLPLPGSAVRLRFDPARAWLFDAQGAALPALGERVAATS
jgi:hypothetical protein